MQRLVIVTSVAANMAMLSVYFVGPNDTWFFVGLLTFSQLMFAAMRMGQASLYRVLYRREIRGRIIGRLNALNYVTMVPAMLLTGWVLTDYPESYRILYPVGGCLGLIAACCYSMLRAPRHATPPSTSIRAGIRGIEKALAHDRIYRYFQMAFFLSGSSFFMSRAIFLELIEDRFAFDAFQLMVWINVVPQVLLAVSSPFWGRVVDRIGVIRSRLLISLLMTSYLASHVTGILTGFVAFIVIGSLLQGMSSGGGQLTWWMASSFAPRPEDVPVYAGIHFFLNGVRGMVMPWVGYRLFMLFGGPFAVVTAVVVSSASIPVVLRALSLKNSGKGRPSLEVVAAGSDNSAVQMSSAGKGSA